jgi:hypothetical protein
MTENDLKKAERSAFQAGFDIGIWDILIASWLSMFAIAPLLSRRLGDFWSAAVFVPVLAVVYILLRMIKNRYVVPRIGVVRLGTYRQARLRKLSVVLLVVNIVALVLGTVFAFIKVEPGSMLAFPIVFSLILFVGFSLAAYFLMIPRFFFYGLLLSVAPFVGEWLWRKGYSPHHGFPVVFGTAATVIAAVGVVILFNRIRGPGSSVDEPLTGENS